MSMVARFLQVTMEQLDALLANPSSVPDLFATEGPPPLTGEGRERFERDAPRMLAEAIGALDSQMQVAMSEPLERLGIDSASLRGGVGGDDLLALADRPAESAGQGSALSLEKAWHGVHYLLCGQTEATADPLGSAVMGGIEIGDDDFGYGPARYFLPDRVAAIATAMAELEDGELAARFDPAQMTGLGIYPGGWQADDAMWLLDGARDLQRFFESASAGGLAVLTCIL